MKYESPTFSGKEAMAKIIFFKVGQTSRSMLLGKINGAYGKVLLQRMYIYNMKTLPLPVRKLWSRLTFYK